MDTAHKVSEIGAQLGYPITCIGVPKTVDNDLSPDRLLAPVLARRPSNIAVFHAPRAALDVRSDGSHLHESIQCWKSWAATRAGWPPPADWHPKKAATPPARHSVSRDRLRSGALPSPRSNRPSRKNGYCVVVVSEGGAAAPMENFSPEVGTKDARSAIRSWAAWVPLVAQMTQEAFGYKFHWAVADYLQRVGTAHCLESGCGSRRTQSARPAVEFALKGKNAVMAGDREEVVHTVSLDHQRRRP